MSLNLWTPLKQGISSSESSCEVEALNHGCRMQSIEARKEYKNSVACATRIFKDEGVLTFWSGAVPRLARLILSGGIVFTMYVSFATGGTVEAD